MIINFSVKYAYRCVNGVNFFKQEKNNVNYVFVELNLKAICQFSK